MIPLQWEIDPSQKELDHWKVIASYILQHKVHRFIEIGVYEGATLAQILRSPAGQVVQEYYAIDSWTMHPEWLKRIKTQEAWDEIYTKTCKFIPEFPQLRLIKEASPKAASIFPDGFFDFVYIDAAHSYEACKADIEAWQPKVRAGGILGGHDYRGRRFGVKPAVLEAFGEGGVILEPCTTWIKHIEEV